MSTLILKTLKKNRTSFLRHSFFLFLITCCITAFAKNPTPFSFVVKGKVIDKNEIGLSGATIIEKGTTNGTSTAADGSFTINLSQPATLVITFVGYQTKEIFVKEAASDLTVTLSTVSGTMESVIVVGYGTQRKLISTAAVSTIKGEQLAVVPAANISNALAGRTTGIITRAQGGRPGADNQTIWIRGQATTGNSSPLIVVDGIPRNNINEIDPNSIESVSVLKDAAAVAPFGLGGANGVILITTKKGMLGAPTISLGGYYGDQQPTYVPKMLNVIDYLKLKQEAWITEHPGGTPTGAISDSAINNYLVNNAKDPDVNPISDALHDIMRQHSPIYQGNVQVRGGNQTVKYFAGISYFKQEGMFDNNNYYRYNYNLNLDVNVTPITTASFIINGASQRTTDIDGGTSQMFRSVYKFLPNAALRYSNGLPGESAGNTPVGVLNSPGYNRRNTNNMLSTIAIDQKLPFIKGLGVKGTVSYDPYNYVNKQWHNPFYFYARNVGAGGVVTYTKSISNQENSTQGYSWLRQDYWQQNTLTLQAIVNYHNTFGKHFGEDGTISE
jgi:TonB-linked SusC/RagA family outer membrane protein